MNTFLTVFLAGCYILFGMMSYYAVVELVFIGGERRLCEIDKAEQNAYRKKLYKKEWGKQLIDIYGHDNIEPHTHIKKDTNFFVQKIY